MTLDELATHCRPLAPGEELPLLRLDDDAELPGVVAWFGADRARRAVRLLVRGEEAGALDRTEVYELVTTQSMGFGDADAAILPGLSTAWSVFQLVCPEAGCPESPLYAVTLRRGTPAALRRPSRPRCSRRSERRRPDRPRPRHRRPVRASSGCCPASPSRCSCSRSLWSGAPGDAPELDRILDEARDLDAWSGGLLFLACSSSRSCSQPLQLGLVRWLEGYWPPALRRLAKPAGGHGSSAASTPWRRTIAPRRTPPTAAEHRRR